MKALALLVGVLWMWPMGASAQQTLMPTRSISLDEALEQAGNQNYTVRQAQADRQVAQAQAAQSRGVFLPRVSLTHQALTTNDPLNAFGFKLKQESIMQEDFNPLRLNDPDRLSHFSTQINISQPVFNPNGLFQRRAAKRRADATQLQHTRTRAAVALQVKQAYYSLVLAERSLAVIDSALAVAHLNRTQTEHFYDQGLLTRADVLAAQVHLQNLESQRTSAATAIQNASDQLQYLLGIADDVTLVPTDDLTPIEVNLDPIDFAQVNQTRSDMQALQLQTSAAQQMVRAGRARFLPTLNVFSTYELNDNSLFGTEANNWTLGAMLTWNLFGGYEQVGRVREARAALSKAELMYDDRVLHNRVEINAARRGLDEAWQQLALATVTIAQAEESLRIRSNRYAQGLEKTTDVLNAEITLANQQLAYLETLYQYHVNIFQLEWLLERPLRN